VFELKERKSGESWGSGEQGSEELHHFGQLLLASAFQLQVELLRVLVQLQQELLLLQSEVHFVVVDVLQLPSAPVVEHLIEEFEGFGLDRQVLHADLGLYLPLFGLLGPGVFDEVHPGVGYRDFPSELVVVANIELYDDFGEIQRGKDVDLPDGGEQTDRSTGCHFIVLFMDVLALDSALLQSYS
jgi:hypothetical protein